MIDIYIGIRESYTKHRRSYAKILRASGNGAPSSSPNTNLAASRAQLDKEYRRAVQKQDQKIELAMRMYDLVSRHIERIDSQMAKSGINDGDWIGQRPTTGSAALRRSWDDTWRNNEGTSRRV